MYSADIHTHSIASGHATQSTITDLAKAAKVRDFLFSECQIMRHPPCAQVRYPIFEVFPWLRKTAVEWIFCMVLN